MKVREKGFTKLIKVEEAKRLIDEKIAYNIREYEEVDLLESLGRISFENVMSPIDVPPFDRAAMDGYAAKAKDITGASMRNPAILKVIGYIEAGDKKETILTERSAVEISTGAPIPKGADTVIPYEETRRTGEYIEVYSAIPPGRNISKKGEDIRRGEVVLRRGEKIKSWNIGVLASINKVKVKVYRKPRVAIISTGNELKELGEKLGEKEIINSTGAMLKALICEVGGEPVYYGNVSDDTNLISKKIMKSIRFNDFIVVTGGTSVGKRDYTIEAVMKAGGKIIFHGVAMRPGKPTALAILNGKPILMLSGYPVAALIGFHLFGRKIMNRICGTKDPPLPKVKAKISRRVASRPGITDFLRVKIYKTPNGLIAEPLKITGSGVLSSIIKSNGLVIISEEKEGLEHEEEVDVIIFKPLEE